MVALLESVTCLFVNVLLSRGLAVFLKMSKIASDFKRIERALSLSLPRWDCSQLSFTFGCVLQKLPSYH